MHFQRRIFRTKVVGFERGKKIGIFLDYRNFNNTFTNAERNQLM